VAIFLVTVEALGSRTTTKVEAAHFFTGEHWVTFWNQNPYQLNLRIPLPVFRRDLVAKIIEKSG
jgi:hypothetical protein